MKNKSQDILYCDVSKEKIDSASPRINKENLKHLFEWIKERYEIHLKKDVQKLSKPWTTNKILQNYKFCNVRREQDKESKWLIKNISNNKEINYNNKILNTILFRLTNKSQTTEIFGVLDFENIDIEKIRKRLDDFKKKNKNYIYFSNAFFTSGPKTQANKLFPEEKDMTIKMVKLTQKYKDKDIVNRIKRARSQKEAYESLISLPGIGEFLAYQIFIDLTYIENFPFSENDFVVAGPGCKKGLNLIFNDFDRLNYAEALFWLRDNQLKIFEKFGYNPEKLFSDLPIEDRFLNLMSLENCMCEISKYIRAFTNTGRPRIKYSGV